MASIQTGIQLQDNFTNTIMGIINSVNLAVSAMEDMNRAMSTGVDTASIAGARNEINQATIAAQQLSQAFENMESPATSSPAVPTPQPVPQTVEWQSDGLEVFNNSGIERYQQEIRSVNAMLSTLNEHQITIDNTASNLNILPDGAIQDITGIHDRIQGIILRIQEIESNPINMGTDRTNNELERLRSQLNQALSEQENLNQAMNDMDVAAANTAYMRLSQTISSTERYIRDNEGSQEEFNQAVQQGTNQANGLINTIKGAVAAYATIQTVKSALNASDELVQTTSRLNMMNDGAQTTQELLEMVYVAAQDARGGFRDMADVVARFGNNAKDAFGSSAEVVQFSNLIQKQMMIAGASTQEASNAMLQLSQALGSGVLRGDELNSIFEQAPNLIQNIADYLDVPIGKIREMAADGELSADIVKNAIFASTDEINAKFNSMPKTWRQVWTSLQNTATMAFQPVLQRLNEIANSEAFQTFLNNAINGIAILAGYVLEVFDLMAQVGTFIADNWDMISPVVYGVVAALAAYVAYLGISNAIGMVSAGIKIAMCVAEYAHAAATRTTVAATTAETAAQYGLNTALLSCPLTWIIVAILALIAVIVALANHFSGAGHVAQSAFGAICGAVATAGAFILNTVIGVINAVLQLVWTFAVEHFIGIIEWILNACNGGFDSFGDAVANLIGQIISWFLSLGKVVTKIIDAIFDTNWTAGLNSLQDSVVAWGKNDNAITLDRTAPSINYRIDYETAYKNGASWGDGITDKVKNTFTSKATKTPSADDYPNALANSNNLAAATAVNTGDTAKNTAKVADAVTTTSEDLKYLRELAETDYINRFTTAQIKVEQINNNTINNDMDLDGVTEHLRSALEEQMFAAAEGVH